jgi:t-SNARE complex subunit (syntaxin)
MIICLFLQRMLEQENQKFYESLDSQFEIAQKTERHVNEISSMITKFNTKVSEQQEIISRIQDDAKLSIENSSKAEKELEKALSIESGSRSITLTFLLVATASLWFLHWYND